MPTTETIKVIEGKTARIECQLYRGEGSLIIWKHKDRVLAVGNLKVKHDKRIDVDENALIIKDISLADSGDYTCEMETLEGELKRYTQQLQVLVPAFSNINQVGSQLTVKAGTSLSLSCSASGIPIPKVRWIKNSIVISEGMGSSDIELTSITRHDGGDIICESFNGIGDIHRDALTLDILYPPEVEILEPQVSFQPKCGIELQCLVHTSSETFVDWLKDDQLLQPKTGITMRKLDNLQVLQIHSCDSSIIGNFTCKARNNFGTSEGVVKVEYDFLEKKILEENLKEESTNNVRRNVHLSEAAPLISSSKSRQSMDYIPIIFLLIISG